MQLNNHNFSTKKQDQSMLMAFQWHRCDLSVFAAGVGTTDMSAGPSPQCHGRGRAGRTPVRAAVAPGSAVGRCWCSARPLKARARLGVAVALCSCWLWGAGTALQHCHTHRARSHRSLLQNSPPFDCLAWALCSINTHTHPPYLYNWTNLFLKYIRIFFS